MVETKEHCSVKPAEDHSSSHSDTDICTKSKYELKADMKEKLTDYPDVLEFIELLQKYIQKQKQKLKKWKSKIKKCKQTINVSVQTEKHDVHEVAVKKEDDKPKTLAEDIKEAAEMAMQNSGFVYEETSGMYYDYNTGYYYNAEYGLYYDGNTGTYYKYNQDSQSYEFHSQVSVPKKEDPSENSHRKRTKRKTKLGLKSKVKSSSDMEHLMHSFTNLHINNLRRQALGTYHDVKKRKRKDSAKSDDSKKSDEVEEGECSQSDSSQSDYDGDNSDSSDISRQYPPCMRIIVESTEVPKMKVGSLHIITIEGGTIGREGKHSIVIPDINISKHHLRISFDKDTGQYQAIDLGSRNGTILNGKRMSPSKQESEPLEITHGSKLQVGATIFLCHIHDGSQTCGHCEPGLVQQPEEPPKRIYRINKTDSHKNELKNLKKKFGVDGGIEETKLASGYTDRAHKRRVEVGSQNPHEKTQVASLDESISSENKGFKLLAKMGWKEGQSLGKDNDGIKEPVKLVANQGTAGIGSNNLINPTTAVQPPENKKIIWKKTQERFQKLPTKNDAFEEADSD